MQRNVSVNLFFYFCKNAQAMQQTITIQNIDDIHRAAKDFLEIIGEHRIIAFFGAMGVGKTTFTKAICEVLGTNDIVNSPTFSIVNEYDYADGNKIYHFDFYRLKNAEEAFDFGIDEYWNSNEFCLMEWSEKVEDILPDNCLKVCISENKNGTRNISFNIN